VSAELGVPGMCGWATCKEDEVCCCNATNPEGLVGYCVSNTSEAAVCSGSTMCPGQESCCEATDEPPLSVSAELEVSGMCGWATCKEDEVCCCNATNPEGFVGYCVSNTSDAAVCSGSTMCPGQESCCEATDAPLLIPIELEVPGLCGWASCAADEVCCCNATSPEGFVGYCVSNTSDAAVCSGSTMCPGQESCCEATDELPLPVSAEFEVPGMCGWASCAVDEVCCCNSTSPQGFVGYCVANTSDVAVCSGSKMCPGRESCCEVASFVV